MFSWLQFYVFFIVSVWQGSVMIAYSCNYNSWQSDRPMSGVKNQTFWPNPLKRALGWKVWILSLMRRLNNLYINSTYNAKYQSTCSSILYNSQRIGGDLREPYPSNCCPWPGWMLRKIDNGNTIVYRQPIVDRSMIPLYTVSTQAVYS